MNTKFEKDHSFLRKNHKPSGNLSLKGYYKIGGLSVFIGFIVVFILNLATPLQFINDRVEYYTQLTDFSIEVRFYLPVVLSLLMGLLFVYFSFRFVLSLILRPINCYLCMIKAGHPLTEGLEEKARRRLLNIPLIFIPANVVMWMMLPIIPVLVGHLSGQIDLRTGVILCARTSMVGLISSFIASHRMEAYSRKELIPFFFPRGRLTEVPGTFRLSISRRIQLLNRLGVVIPGIILLVTLVTLQWEVDASGVSAVEYGHIVIRFSFILYGLFFIITHVLNKFGTNNITDPIKEIIHTLMRIRLGKFNQTVQVVSNDEIGYMGDVINEMAEGLKERDSMKQSLQLAREVQQNLLPKENPKIEGLDISAKSIYCDETGGDYFDFIPLNANRPKDIAIVIGDVSGHGISSALLMASARAFIRQRTSLPGRAQQIIMDVNRQIVQDVEKSGQFMTLLYMIINQEERCVEWVRAGHDPGIFYDPGTRSFEDLAGPGVALGIDEKWDYISSRKKGLKEGQIIALGTDGIWEARNARGEMFGKKKLHEIIQDNSDATAEKLLNLIIGALHKHRKGIDLQDDVTLVIIKIEQ
jgi:sigma-B regulation protein RsbU (phosphoserine phosphatase)